ncbi:MAG: prepilin-type N-terminal cleavage/methylation domain-containing protein [Proteobacteria bacterium]|nr:prepilin-type N-terminal cleavage/methylation domain-containing protein [Pseudomonadota bacterium]
MQTTIMPSHRGEVGFTLMELVVVIIVIGILAAVVMSGSTPISSSRLAHADALKSHIRYAQSRAMKTGQTWGINCDGTSYWLFNGADSSVANAVALPGETALSINLASRNISLTTFNTLAFDISGRPYSTADLSTALAADLLITLTATDDATVSTTLTIIEETGYVQQ